MNRINLIADLKAFLATLADNFQPPKPRHTVGTYRTEVAQPLFEVFKCSEDVIEASGVSPELLYRLRDALPFHGSPRGRRLLRELIGDLLVSLSAPTVVLENDARDAWLYRQFSRKERGVLVPHKEIRKRLQAKHEKLGWNITDISSLKRAANRWAERNHKAVIPKRQQGRTSES